MRTLIEIPNGKPLEIKDFEVSRERRGVLKDRSKEFIKAPQCLLDVSTPITGDDIHEYIAFLNQDGSVYIYFRRKPERKAFPRQKIDSSVLGKFIGSFNAQVIVSHEHPRNKKREIAEWIERTIKQSWIEVARVAVIQLSIRI